MAGEQRQCVALTCAQLALAAALLLGRSGTSLHRGNNIFENAGDLLLVIAAAGDIIIEGSSG